MKLIKRGLSLLMAVVCVAACGFADAAPIPNIGFLYNQYDGLDGPTRVSSGNGVYVTDTSWGEVAILDPSGNRLGTIKESNVPRGIKVLPNGNIAIGFTNGPSGGYVSLYSSSGTFLRRLGEGVGQFSFPNAITGDPASGRIYVADSVRSAVFIFDSAGNYLSYFGGYGYTPDKLDFPAGIAFDTLRNEVLVADQGNFKIKVYDPNGTYIRMFGQSAPDSSFIFGDTIPNLLGKFSKIIGVAVDSQSRAYIVDSFQSAVQVYDSPAGLPLTVFGDHGTGNGELKTPTDVTIDSANRVVIADWNNNRLAFFQIDGPPAPPTPANTAPGAPSLATPGNGSSAGSMSLSLTASNSTDAEGHALQYLFQVDTSNSFNSAGLINATVPAGASFTTAIVTVPVDHTTYYWRVKAQETATTEHLESAWSPAWSFSVHASNRLPSTPGNLSPAAGTQLAETDSLSWSASSDLDGDAITYTVDISTQATFASITESKNVGSNSVAITQFASLVNQPSATYYWRVKAVDNRGGSSSYSSSNSFVYGTAGGTLQVSTNPTGALVYIDGNYGYLGTYKGVTGATPLSIPVEPGRHVVRIIRGGNYEYYATYNVTQGQTVTVNATLSTYASYSVRDIGTLSAGGSTLGNSSPDFSYSAPFAVDWDNDGDKDLLIGANTGNVHYYRNNGTDASPSMSYIGVISGVSTGDGGAYPFVVDWNSDGMKDLLVGNRSGNVLLYINSGTDAMPLFNIVTTMQAGGVFIDAGSYAAPTVVDWNNDGMKDLLIGNSSGYVRRYTSTGTDIDGNPLLSDSGNLMMGSSTLRAGNYATPQVIDWDRDGRKDLIVGASSNGVYWFRNVGTDAAPSFSSYNQLPDSSGKLKDVTYAVPFILDWNNFAPYDLLVGGQDGTVRRFMK